MSTRQKPKWPKVVGTHVPMYGGTVVLAHTRQDFVDVLNFCMRYTGEAQMQLDSVPNGGASTSLKNDEGKRMYVVGVFDGTRQTLVHELAHATFNIFEDIKEDASPGKPNEAFCYLLDYLYGEFEPELRKRKKKRK